MGDKGSGLSPAFVPVIAFLGATAICWHFGFDFGSLEPVALVSLGSTVASVGATMLGFLLASLAVLASINHTHLVGMMRETGHYIDLLATVLYSCVTFLACTVIGFVLVFGVTPSSWLGFVAVGLHVAALASLLDVGRKFWFVLSNLRSA